jgi:phage terminase small subunit
MAAKGQVKAKTRPPQLNPFDRRSNETDPAWKAFQCYRNMGEGRTLDKARKELGRREGYMRQLEEWSSDHEWVNRVRAWDDAEARRKVVGDDPLDAALGLTLKQKLFAEAYVTNGGNGVRAAMVAGYNSTNYNVMASIASENLRKPEVRAYIDHLTRDLSMGASEVLYRLTEIAHGDMREFIGKSYRELKAHNQGHLIKKIETRVEVVKEDDDDEKPRLVEVTKIELYSKADALQLLGRYHKLFVDRVQVEDWRNELIPLVRQGAVTFETAVKEIGIDLATQLFESAGVAIAPS